MHENPLLEAFCTHVSSPSLMVTGWDKHNYTFFCEMAGGGPGVIDNTSKLN